MIFQIILTFYYFTFQLETKAEVLTCSNLTNPTSQNYFWSLLPPKNNKFNYLQKNYIFGSIHVSWDLIWDFVPNKIKNIMLEETEIAVFENDLLNHTNLQNIFKCLNKTETNKQSQYLLSKELIFSIEEAISTQNSSGIVSLGPFSQINFRKMPPDWIYISLLELIQQNEMIALKGIPLLTLDYYIQEQMFNNKKNIILKNIENFNVSSGQCPSILPSIGIKNISNAIKIMLKVLNKVKNLNNKNKNIASIRIDLYKCGLLASEEGREILKNEKNKFIGPELDKIENIVNKDLLQLRNKHWVEKVEKLILDNPNKTFLFTFSVDHFIGQFNLIDLLKQKGYRIEPILFGKQKIIKNKKNKTKIKLIEINGSKQFIEQSTREVNQNITTKENNNIFNTTINYIVLENNYTQTTHYDTNNTTFYFFNLNTIKSNKTFIVIIVSIAANLILMIILFLCSKFYTWKRHADEYRVKDKFSSSIMERLEDEQTDNSENMVIIGKNSVKYIANGSTNK